MRLTVRDTSLSVHTYPCPKCGQPTTGLSVTDAPVVPAPGVPSGSFEVVTTYHPCGCSERGPVVKVSGVETGW